MSKGSKACHLCFFHLQIHSNISLSSLPFRVKPNGEFSSSLYLDAYLTTIETEDKSITYPLYPFDSTKLKILFVYGTEYQRQLNLFSVPKSKQALSILIILFLLLALIVLCLIRMRLKLPRSGFISTSIDMIIAFIGGGNLQMRNKFDRWFFAIMLVGAFFLNSIFTGDLLDSVYQLQNQKIETFEKLASINSPIYAHPTLSPYSDEIHAMLK